MMGVLEKRGRGVSVSTGEKYEWNLRVLRGFIIHFAVTYIKCGAGAQSCNAMLQRRWVWLFNGQAVATHDHLKKPFQVEIL